MSRLPEEGLIARVEAGERAIELRAPRRHADAIALVSTWPAKDGGPPRSIGVGLTARQVRLLIAELSRAVEGLEGEGGRRAAVWVARATEGEARGRGVPPASFRAAVK